MSAWLVGYVVVAIVLWPAFSVRLVTIDDDRSGVWIALSTSLGFWLALVWPVSILVWGMGLLVWRLVA
jgi:hypothetical protein